MNGREYRRADVGGQLQSLIDMINRIAPDNIAQNPIGMMLEGDIWSVDVHVHIKGTTEYEATGTSENLADAIVNTRKHLSKHSTLETYGRKDAARFNYEI